LRENRLGWKALVGEHIRAEGVSGRTDEGGRRLRENRLGWKALEGEHVRAEGVSARTD